MVLRSVLLLLRGLFCQDLAYQLHLDTALTAPSRVHILNLHEPLHLVVALAVFETLGDSVARHAPPRFGRFEIILQSQTLDDPLQKRRQILIHIRDQIAVFGLGDPGGNPLDPVEPGSKRIPAIIDVMGLELGPNQMGCMIRQYRGEQMPFNAFILL